MGYVLDESTLDDLVEFARLEIETHDVEPWAEVFRAMLLSDQYTREEVCWATTLYNTYDSLSSAWGVFRRWPTPQAWLEAPDRLEARQFPCMQERRNLHGGKVNRRHETYAVLLDGEPQQSWMFEPLMLDSPGADFERLTAHMRQVWGVGRQAAFEWAEFMGKVLGLPVDAADGQLWESSGPRRSLELIYGNDNPSPEELDAMANECKGYIADNGVALEWVDFETIICDFKVMRLGNYHVGKHLEALKEEVIEVQDVWPEDGEFLMGLYNSVVPDAWAGIPPGIDKARNKIYRDTGIVAGDRWW